MAGHTIVSGYSAHANQKGLASFLTGMRAAGGNGQCASRGERGGESSMEGNQGNQIVFDGFFKLSEVVAILWAGKELLFCFLVVSAVISGLYVASIEGAYKASAIISPVSIGEVKGIVTVGLASDGSLPPLSVSEGLEAAGAMFDLMALNLSRLSVQNEIDAARFNVLISPVRLASNRFTGRIEVISFANSPKKAKDNLRALLELAKQETISDLERFYRGFGAEVSAKDLSFYRIETLDFQEQEGGVEKILIMAFSLVVGFGGASFLLLARETRLVRNRQLKLH